MNYTVVHNDGHLIIKLNESSIHAGHTSILKGEFVQLCMTHKVPMILDLQAVQMLDSSALSAFLLLRRQLEEANLPLYIVHLQPSVKKIFEISKLDNIFMIMPTLDEALKELATWQKEKQANDVHLKKEDDYEEEEWSEEDWDEEDWEDEEDEWEDEEDEWDDEEDWDEEWEEEEEEEEEESA